MKKLVVLSFLVSSVYVTGVYAALGFPFDIPNLSASVSSAIGSGVRPLTIVNTATVAIASLDRTGTITIIQKIIKAVSEPLNALLTKLRSASNAKSTDPDSLVRALTHLFEKANVGLGEATKQAARFDMKLRPSVQNEIVNALSYLNYTMDSLERETLEVKRAIVQATRAQPPVASSTVSFFVTPTLVNRISSSIASIVSGMSRLAIALQDAVATRNSAINYQQSVKQSVSASLANINSLIASWNNSLDSARTSIDQTSESVAKMVNSTFNPITSHSFDWNNGNIDPLITFLAQFDYLQQSFIALFDEGIDYIKESTMTVFEASASQLSELLYKVSADMSDTGSASDSAYADSCVSKYNGILLSAPTSINRLGECIQAESSFISTVETNTNNVLEQEKESAVKKMALLQKCIDKNGPCVATLFATLNYESAQTIYVGMIYNSYSMYYSSTRISDCLTATAADIDSLAHKIQRHFNHCLTSGTYIGVRLKKNG